MNQNRTAGLATPAEREAPATLAKYRAGDEKQDWRRIPIDDLIACNSALSYFDAEGMRFHLPAYLVAMLRGDYGHGLEFYLTLPDDELKKSFALLSAEQRSAVGAFLAFILAGETTPSRDALRALNGFWSKGGC